MIRPILTSQFSHRISKHITALHPPKLKSLPHKSSALPYLSRKLTSTTSTPPSSLGGLLDEIPLNAEYFNYPRLTARQTALRITPPRESQMLVRDFIDDSLYNPNYGYFSKQAMIFSPQNDFDFNGIKDNLEFMNLVGSKYLEFENGFELKDKNSAKQIWHTSTELFKPWYGYAFAKYIVTEYKLNGNPQHDLIIYELGAGNGTLMLNVLDYIQKFEPAIYKKTKYRIVEISIKLAEKQRQIQDFRKIANGHNCIEIINKNIFDWDEPVNEPCFFLACEVLDNFAHDVIRYEFLTEKPVQGVVVTNEKGEYEEIYEPVNDPLIMRYLSLRNKTTYKTPALQRRLYRKMRNKLPLAPNLTQPEFIPTKMLLFLDVLKDYFPQHRLVISDFYKLPDSIQGIDAPVVQTRYQNTMVPCSTYMVHPGWFDIFFPTNFELLKDIYQLVCRSSRAESEKVKVLLQKEFLKRYAELARTQTKSGENPILMYYENVKFLLS
ncbi:19488_t:CDS:2 [Funneliformis geosporum]|uniref:Protein arginine methyltransferase NDUFAF7 n=1 Tax=Funneliformis geosporum TaxID=1117311 RepID=A0A9W4SIY1_9GLOM|nr:19488_t:CDS:2 [Funneliformis geosporum]CAI2170007.1 16552_t:CDS:2 [Funneliformis geosporum]